MIAKALFAFGRLGELFYSFSKSSFCSKSALFLKELPLSPEKQKLFLPSFEKSYLFSRQSKSSFCPLLKELQDFEQKAKTLFALI